MNEESMYYDTLKQADSNPEPTRVFNRGRALSDDVMLNSDRLTSQVT